VEHSTRGATTDPAATVPAEGDRRLPGGADISALENAAGEAGAVFRTQLSASLRNASTATRPGGGLVAKVAGRVCRTRGLDSQSGGNRPQRRLAEAFIASRSSGLAAGGRSALETWV